VALIEILITGGTIAKSYDEISGELIFDEEHLKKMILQSRVNFKPKITKLFLKDSLDMDEDDRQMIYEAVNSSSSKKIIILHGTDTMVQTASKLSTITGKRIILTGAMIPYAFKNSDALFNLGSAFGAIGTNESGVFILMNGTTFKWDEVKKDKKLGEFVKKI